MLVAHGLLRLDRGQLLGLRALLHFGGAQRDRFLDLVFVVDSVFADQAEPVRAIRRDFLVERVERSGQAFSANRDLGRSEVLQRDHAGAVDSGHQCVIELFDVGLLLAEFLN